MEKKKQKPEVELAQLEIQLHNSKQHRANTKNIVEQTMIRNAEANINKQIKKLQALVT